MGHTPTWAMALLLTSTLWVGGCKEKEPETCRRVKACCTALEPMDKAFELGEFVGEAFSRACSYDSTDPTDCDYKAMQIGRAFREASIPLHADKKKPPRRPPACDELFGKD
jgi:hypothetical protein